MNPLTAESPAGVASRVSEYWVDAAQRTILFWDVMRRRGNNYLEHLSNGQPAVLKFEHEMVLDGRRLPRPCNYALLWIKPDAEHPMEPTKRPYVVVDPRAGHGPGIGGSKLDSQVGVALRAGHPVYFVTFFPDPVPGQRLRDVAAAEAAFIEEVTRRHPQATGKPCVVGNCQAGWAVAALASVRPEIMGPILLNGAPLSYWSGANNTNPMRYTGGLLGGKWIESLACDLGHGLFDGANLVVNFETLDPANTLWKKYDNLYAKIDTEAERFLGFETWWGGYFLMNQEEIDAIVSELFIGNKLARGGIANDECGRLDLRNICSPIVVFASFGDNITPPQQALNWIEDVYGDEQAIIDADRTIVYLLHKDIGHLGIFVSGRVAAKEHTELVGTLEMIDALPAGLYEMVIETKPEDARAAELEPGQYVVRFESRTIDDIRSLDDTREDEAAFSAVDAVSRLNDGWYRTMIGPWVKGMTSEESAALLRRLHPLRLQRELLSDLNPAMRVVGTAAAAVREHRLQVAPDNPLLTMERAWSGAVVAALDCARDIRDAWTEACFKRMYGPMGVGALFPPSEEPADERDVTKAASVKPADADYTAGGALAGVLRMVALGVLDRGDFDRRSALIFRELRAHSRFSDVRSEHVRELFRQQARLIRHDRERAIATLADLLKSKEERVAAAEAVRKVLMVRRDEIRMERPLVARVAGVLNLKPEDLGVETREASKRPVPHSHAARTSRLGGSKLN